jgi:hypothetical protein
MVMVRFVRVCLDALPLCHTQVIESRTLVRQGEGHTLKSQDNHEGLRALPLKSMECEKFSCLDGRPPPCIWDDGVYSWNHS